MARMSYFRIAVFFVPVVPFLLALAFDMAAIAWLYALLLWLFVIPVSVVSFALRSRMAISLEKLAVPFCIGAIFWGLSAFLYAQYMLPFYRNVVTGVVTDEIIQSIR